MFSKLFRLASEMISPSPKNSVASLYAKKDYLAAYAEHTDLRVDQDPHEAVGGMWEEIGTLQFDFLVGQGLEPRHKLLDIGCGTLRGGRHFVKYLQPGNYTGIDISPKAIEYASQLVHEENLADQRPRLLVSENKDLKFAEFKGETFDYLLAQSVFTHLKPDHIEECFQHVGGIMTASSAFFFTFNEGDSFQQTGPKGFKYPYGFFADLANRYGFRLDDLSAAYPHPKNQHMLRLIKK